MCAALRAGPRPGFFDASLQYLQRQCSERRDTRSRWERAAVDEESSLESVYEAMIADRAVIADGGPTDTFSLRTTAPPRELYRELLGTKTLRELGLVGPVALVAFPSSARGVVRGAHLERAAAGLSDALDCQRGRELSAFWSNWVRGTGRVRVRLSLGAVARHGAGNPRAQCIFDDGRGPVTVRPHLGAEAGVS